MNNGISEGLKTSLNAIREISSDIYHRYIPIIDDETAIGTFAEPILSIPEVYNDFCNALVNRIVYTSFEIKAFRNPLVVLEGDRIPLGYAGQEVYVNPARGRKYNPNDFAGLLVKYEADVKVQYMAINMDVQYPVTFSRQDLKKAFVTWNDLETFIDGLSNSLYNGAYIDEYRFTKAIVANAYRNNAAQIQVVNGLTTEENAKNFLTQARSLYLNFQTPSSAYNAWAKVGGEGRPIVTWSNPEDIVFILRNDIRSYIDVNVLASSFNISSADLMGRVITVDNFNILDDDLNVIYDGSNILGIMADRSWFRIKRQDMFMDSFYNPNNRSIQYYLNLIKMYNYSLFANGVIFATANPNTTNVSEIEFAKQNVVIGEGQTEEINTLVRPVGATTPAITYTSSNTDVLTVTKVNQSQVKITGVSAGTSIVTAKAGDIVGSFTVEVLAQDVNISAINFGTNEVNVTVGASETLELTITPAAGNSDITYSSSNAEVFTAQKLTNNTVKVTGVSAGSATLIATTGTVTATTTITVASA